MYLEDTFVVIDKEIIKLFQFYNYKYNLKLNCKNVINMYVCMYMYSILNKKYEFKDFIVRIMLQQKVYDKEFFQ